MMKRECLTNQCRDIRVFCFRQKAICQFVKEALGVLGGYSQKRTDLPKGCAPQRHAVDNNQSKLVDVFGAIPVAYLRLICGFSYHVVCTRVQIGTRITCGNPSRVYSSVGKCVVQTNLAILSDGGFDFSVYAVQRFRWPFGILPDGALYLFSYMLHTPTLSETALRCFPVRDLTGAWVSILACVVHAVSLCGQGVSDGISTLSRT